MSVATLALQHQEPARAARRPKQEEKISDTLKQHSSTKGADSCNIPGDAVAASGCQIMDKRSHASISKRS